MDFFLGMLCGVVIALLFSGLVNIALVQASHRRSQEALRNMVEGLKEFQRGLQEIYDLMAKDQRDKDTILTRVLSQQQEQRDQAARSRRTMWDAVQKQQSQGPK